MGNCQAVDTATLVIQHPSGKVERFYWPLSASEVMRTNPGHYVALVLTLCLPPDSTTSHPNHNNTTNKDHKDKKEQLQHHHHHQQQQQPQTTSTTNNEVRITRVKVLRPTDTLVLGQAYRLVTSEEVMKGLWARKYAKKKKDNATTTTTTESTDKPPRLKPEQQQISSASETQSINSHLDNPNQVQVAKQERHRPRTPSAPSASTRSRPWRPSLQSISEMPQGERR
ncbi:pyrroline-5-carboxylate reductase 1-like [Telopea speciosissima]|uniref:pyrroline-5-carboxylate reductase 1-like n=1 Tax=Telopea speciosissima TaxID=54955 RepID=UPI001CC4541E|nr:pyrroline-5-carboxylate reductase 1-like [Telopea speciosissima]